MGNSSGFSIAYARCSWARLCATKTADKIKVTHYPVSEPLGSHGSVTLESNPRTNRQPKSSGEAHFILGFGKHLILLKKSGPIFLE